METKFYFCPICGNLIFKVNDSGVTPHCCGQAMTELIPNTSDGAGEKHVPVIKMVDDKTLRVEIGAQPHPMTAAHHIEFICVETPAGIQLRRLDQDKPASADFACPAGDHVKCCHSGEKEKECHDKTHHCVELFVTAYAYCNLHGLWKACE